MRRTNDEPKPFTEEQVIAILREHEAGHKTADLCRKQGISSATFYAWKAKFGGLDVSQARKLRVLEDENAKLKKLLAEAMLANAVLKEVTSKNWSGLPLRGRWWSAFAHASASVSVGPVPSWGSTERRAVRASTIR